MDNTIQAEAVLKMQEYIEAHVFDTVTPGKLSRISGYSPWYASRLFLNFLNITPVDYMRRLRLSKSALRLRDEKVRVIDIAYDAGFESVAYQGLSSGIVYIHVGQKQLPGQEARA